ncbi:DNA replication/repair protein RecF [Alphaproteobacteria bacterium KMM 3653]|uniref:DNA replication and repair protein RecF n=1 Tax=Harenicola maris TaxID=2841044 RepID=A0AAP2CN12_9RHOB|nr:DNA replication/repair protein RecF [Harenicola maris]
MAGLSIRHLRVALFRSYRAVRLDLTPGPVAIYGPNGAGKTNILEAVSLLSPGRGIRRASAEDMARRPDPQGWKIHSEIESLGHVHEVTTWSEAGNARQVTIDEKTAPQLALGRLCRVVWLIPAMDRLWIEGAEGRRRFLDRMVLSFDPAHGEAVLSYEKAMRERNRLLKDMVRDASWYRVLERQMADSAAKIHSGREETLMRIAAAQDGAATQFPAADLTLTAPEPACDDPTNPEAMLEQFERGRAGDLRAGRTLTGPHRADLDAVYAAKGIAAKDCSTGEQKALLLSLMLSNARALAEDFGAPPLLLLDEVAAHLDAGRRAALYDEIIALKAQAWMTGTGPELFAELEGRSQMLEVTEGAEGSAVRQV